MRHGVGRPRHLYDVTAEAQDLFPSNYDALATGLLAAIEAVGGDDLLDQVFAARRRQLGDRVREQMADRVGEDAPLVDRVRELAVVQADQGYLADMTLGADGTIRLREHNCAIFHIAEGSPAACQAELELFTEILGADVVREQHIALRRPLLLLSDQRKLAGAISGAGVRWRVRRSLTHLGVRSLPCSPPPSPAPDLTPNSRDRTAPSPMSRAPNRPWLLAELDGDGAAARVVAGRNVASATETDAPAAGRTRLPGRRGRDDGDRQTVDMASIAQ